MRAARAISFRAGPPHSESRYRGAPPSLLYFRAGRPHRAGHPHHFWLAGHVSAPPVRAQNVNIVRERCPPAASTQNPDVEARRPHYSALGPAARTILFMVLRPAAAPSVMTAAASIVESFVEARRTHYLI